MSRQVKLISYDCSNKCEFVAKIFPESLETKWRLIEHQATSTLSNVYNVAMAKGRETICFKLQATARATLKIRSISYQVKSICYTLFIRRQVFNPFRSKHYMLKRICVNMKQRVQSKCFKIGSKLKANASFLS
jgi:hypothetical protein